MTRRPCCADSASNSAASRSTPRQRPEVPAQIMSSGSLSTSNLAAAAMFAESNWPSTPAPGATACTLTLVQMMSSPDQAPEQTWWATRSTVGLEDGTIRPTRWRSRSRPRFCPGPSLYSAGDTGGF